MAWLSSVRNAASETWLDPPLPAFGAIDVRGMTVVLAGGGALVSVCQPRGVCAAAMGESKQNPSPAAAISHDRLRVIGYFLPRANRRPRLDNDMSELKAMRFQSDENSSSLASPGRNSTLRSSRLLRVSALTT